MLVMLNSGVLSPTMPSTVSRGQRAVNGARTTVNNRAFVVTHNNKTGKANNVVFLRPKLQAGLLFWKQRKGSLSLLPQRFKHLQPRLVVAMKTYSLTNGECRESLIKPHVGPEALKSPGKLGCSFSSGGTLLSTCVQRNQLLWAFRISEGLQRQHSATL